MNNLINVKDELPKGDGHVYLFDRDGVMAIGWRWDWNLNYSLEPYGRRCGFGSKDKSIDIHAMTHWQTLQCGAVK
jgi:hypothetical protein